jgi:Cof subfamily protein (haloacid dehalogenase superfamily)
MLRANLGSGRCSPRMMAMYKLVVSDLDGTLLGPDHRLGDYTRGVLARVHHAGADLVLASGRHFMDIRVLAGQLGGDATLAAARQRGALVSCNGAAVNAADGRLLQTTCIAPDALAFLTRDPLFRQVQTNVFVTDAWLVEQAEPSLLRYHQDSGFRYRVVDFGGLDGSAVLKVFYYGEHAHLVDLEAAIRERHDGRLGTTFSLPQTLEVMAAGVSKGAALARLLADFGLTPADVVCYGDGLNDLEMLALIHDGGGLALLMANADARLHAALPDLPRIGSHAEEAVARHLEGLLAADLLADGSRRRG